MMGDTYDTYKEIAEVVWQRQRIMITMVTPRQPPARIAAPPPQNSNAI